MMQKNSSAVQQVKEQQEHARRDAVIRKLKAILFENWGTKLLALLIAVALWAGLITQDPSLTREKVFSNVTVSAVGADTLRRNGFIVLEDLKTALKDVSVRVDVPQGQYAAAQASNYSIRIDLSRVNSAGEQDLKIMATNSVTYGTVLEIVPSTVRLTVDEYVTRYRIPVTVTTQGEAPEGFYASDPSTDPPTIAVSGPKSVVERIASARVVADQTNLPPREGSVRRAIAFSLVDENGKEIHSDLLQVTSESVLLDSIIVEQQVYTKRVVELSDLGLVVGEPAPGYEIKGVYISPGSVTIAGRATIVNGLKLLYADGTVDVNGATESINKSLRVRQPATLKYASTDMVTVAVEIGPVITSRTYEAKVELTGLAATLREAGGVRTAAVHLTGAQPWLDKLRPEDLLLTCDLSSIAAPGPMCCPSPALSEVPRGRAIPVKSALPAWW